MLTDHFQPAMERCLELMTEDPERQRRRMFLVKEKEKVSKAQEWLASAKKDDTGDDAQDKSQSDFTPLDTKLDAKLDTKLG